jgi:proteasome accessory factor A
VTATDVPPPLDVEPSRRIFGLETEYGLYFDYGGPRKVTVEEVAGAFFHSVVLWGRSSNVFLPNGARLYLDVGAHPEYATAECDTLADLVAQDRAGERIVAALVEGGEKRLAEAGLSGEIHVFKNNTDSAGNSYGCHENYLVRRRADFTAFAESLLPFLVTRQIVAGAGGVTGTGPDARYCFSPRADHMWEAMSSATTRSRPMINTRDEPHAHADLYRRLHVIVGDSNMAESSTLFKVGATDLVLRLLEMRLALPRLELARPMQAVRDVSHDLTGRARVDVSGGRSMTAIEIQRSFLDEVRNRLGRDVEADAMTTRVVDLWARGIEAVESGDSSAIETELDWAVKRRLIDRFRERTGAALDDARVARLELAYHDIAPRRGLVPSLVRDGLLASIVDEEDVEAAEDEPPATTRAALRGRFVRAARDRHAEVSADWVRLKVVGESGRTVLLKDPFRSEDDRVDALIDSMGERPAPVD